MKYFTLNRNQGFISRESTGPGAAMTIFNEYKEKIEGIYFCKSW